MPIGAEQWRAVVGSNNVRRPRQVRIKKDTRIAIEKEITWNCTLMSDCNAINLASWLLLLPFAKVNNLSSVCWCDNAFNIMPQSTISQLFVFMIIVLLLLLAGDVETNPGPSMLTLENLREVNDVVYDVRSKWYQLGLNLGIHPRNMDAIEHQCQQDSGKCLLKLLHEWLNSGEANWEKLIIALKDKTLREISLATKLEGKYCLTLESSVSGSEMKLSEIDSTEAEHESVLNMSEISEILSDNDTESNLDAENDYEVNSASAADESSLYAYVEDLKAKYLKQTLPAEGMLEHSNQICRLAMIKKEKVNDDDEFIHKTITGKVDDILLKKEPVELKFIFKDVPKDRKIVLIEGAPGAGKSSLSLNICKKWSEEEMFQEFKVVILVRLRDPRIQIANSIAELLPHCERSTSLNVEAVIKKTGGNNMLWVLDGWDEFPDQLKSDDACFVRNLLYKQNHNSSIIVTSRPTSSVKLHPLVSKRIEILGFTSDELRQYFEHRLNDDTKSVETLLEKIKEYPEVQSSCYLPLHAGFIADTFLIKEQDLPSTQYGIFETVIVKCISRYQIKQKKKEISSLDDLPDDIQKNFLALCELAYKGHLESKIIFTESDLSADFKTLDLLQDVESMVAFQGGVSRTYNFLHLSVQEFLAAQQLARRPLYEQYWLFRGLMEDDRCLPMLTFYAAKTKLSAPGIAEFVSKVGERYFQARRPHEEERLHFLLSFVIKCICETEDSSLCKPLITALSTKLLLLNDYYSLGSFLSLSTGANIGNDNVIQIENIRRQSIQDSDWNLFVKGLLRFYKGKCVSPLKTNCLRVLPSDPILGVLQDTKVIHVSNLIVSGAIKDIDPIHFFPHRRKIIPSKTVKPYSPNQFSNSLKQLIGQGMVSSLTIDDTNMSTCEGIAEGLKLTVSLLELHLPKCNITSSDCAILSEGLSLNKTVKLLNLSSNKLRGGGIKYISEIFRLNSLICDLILCDCKLSSQDLALLTEIDNIKKLLLSSNKNIGDRGAEILAKNLQKNEVLQILAVDSCGITSAGSRHLLALNFILEEKSSINKLLICSPPQIKSSKHRYWRDLSLELDEYDNAFDVDSYAVDPHYEEPASNLHTFSESTLSIPVDNSSTDRLCEILVNSFCSLHTVILSSKGFKPPFINRTIEVLKKNVSIKVFQLKDGSMTFDNLKAFGDVLENNTSLTEIFLDNSIEQPENPSAMRRKSRKTLRSTHFSSISSPKYRQPDHGSQCFNSQGFFQQTLREALDYLAHCLVKNYTLKILRLPIQCNASFLEELQYRRSYLSHMPRLSVLHPGIYYPYPIMDD